jgi:hypothetical protein
LAWKVVTTALAFDDDEEAKAWRSRRPAQL